MANEHYEIAGAILYTDFRPSFALPILKTKSQPARLFVQIMSDTSAMVVDFLELEQEIEITYDGPSILVKITDEYVHAFIDASGGIYFGTSEELDPILRAAMNSRDTASAVKFMIADQIKDAPEQGKIRDNLTASIQSTFGALSAATYLNGVASSRLWDVLAAHAKDIESERHIRRLRATIWVRVSNNGHVSIHGDISSLEEHLTVPFSEIHTQISQEFSGVRRTRLAYEPGEADQPGLSPSPAKSMHVSYDPDHEIPASLLAAHAQLALDTVLPMVISAIQGYPAGSANPREVPSAERGQAIDQLGRIRTAFDEQLSDAEWDVQIAGVLKVTSGRIRSLLANTHDFLPTTRHMRYSGAGGRDGDTGIPEIDFVFEFFETSNRSIPTPLEALAGFLDLRAEVILNHSLSPVFTRAIDPVVLKNGLALARGRRQKTLIAQDEVRSRLDRLQVELEHHGYKIDDNGDSSPVTVQFTIVRNEFLASNPDVLKIAQASLALSQLGGWDVEKAEHSVAGASHKHLPPSVREALAKLLVAICKWLFLVLPG